MLELSGINVDTLERYAITGVDGSMPVRVRHGRFSIEIAAVILPDGSEGIEVRGVESDSSLRIEPVVSNVIHVGRRNRGGLCPAIPFCPVNRGPAQRI